MNALEEKLAHLEKTVDDLSDIVARQDKDIRILQARVAFLMEREASREGEGAEIVGDERPPHY
ncbi:SlyX family protein [Shimia ponticola]|uniref:SlyX family protein n=1 Tax=Shimia ponticola TaxID=2582893 RepID=UPI0011BF0210|nr:SlyX family protein [Shimia ponticola]